MGRLVQLIYVSSAARLLDEQALRAILESSVRHNTPQAVTGMLLYANGAFMQVLEGDEAAVAETMSRIR
ncbi:MAG: BLUF domain-containing protein, partial [Zoogloea sp.]|nr:BLUF domain-containing protein [Zoogloea sp.]